MNHNHPLLCQAKDRIQRRHPPTNLERASLIASHEKLWTSGTRLRYYMWDHVGDEQMEVVNNAFTTWENVTGLYFEETIARATAEIRISWEDDGSWSYIGKDCLKIAEQEATMNFGWDLTAQPDTALHEIGHALGMNHEHQNPRSGIEFDHTRVLTSLMGPPNNWDEDTVDRNVFRKLPPNSLGSAWDPNSIMEYPFGPGMIKQPELYADGLKPEPGLSPTDMLWANRMYPAMPEPTALYENEQADVTLVPGEQVWFRFMPRTAGRFRFSTLGTCDTVLVLFDAAGKFIAGDDDSGEDNNASIWADLDAGKYSLRLRQYWSEGAGKTNVLASRW